MFFNDNVLSQTSTNSLVVSLSPVEHWLVHESCPSVGLRGNQEQPI